jgi:DNA integrity scanning protein DisA with diadenylate cyclase activity
MPSMTQGDLRNSRYEQHIQALEEHKTLLDQINKADEDVHLAEITFSLEKLSVTLQEYFKVIGIL